MHIFVKDDPYHSSLGLVDSQLKNLVLAFMEAPALYKVIPIRSKTALETAVLDELAESGFCANGSLFAFAVSLPEAVKHEHKRNVEFPLPGGGHAV